MARTVSFCLIFLLLASSAIANENIFETLNALEEKGQFLIESLENTKNKLQSANVSLERARLEMQNVTLELENMKSLLNEKDEIINEHERLLKEQRQDLQQQIQSLEVRKQILEKDKILLISQLEQAKRWESLYSGLKNSFEDYKKAQRRAMIKTAAIGFGVGILVTFTVWKIIQLVLD